MADNALAPLAAAVCFLVAALVQRPGWRLATWLTATGCAALAGGIAARGLLAGHWPLTGEYEFALAFSFTTGLAALAFDLKSRHRSFTVETVVLVLAASLALYARLLLPSFQRAITPLLPALDSIWLPLHAGTAALAYGSLAVAGAAGLAWLVRQPDRTAAEWILDRAIAAGYPLLTLSMILGMIWAQVAWGRYWSWDLKEAWTLAAWLVYTLYWHLHRRPGWPGRRLAWLALAGLSAVLFTFLRVGWLARSIGLESLHLF
jgi:ABC-type transport system involved in cytochrome c biogenesis permease subunit